eukprot:UN21531
MLRSTIFSQLKKVLIDKHFSWATRRPVCNCIFPFEIPMKKYILTNQMKNEYFQENEKKTIEITREMILFDDPNEIIERKSKTEGK